MAARHWLVIEGWSSKAGRRRLVVEGWSSKAVHRRLVHPTTMCHSLKINGSDEVPTPATTTSGAGVLTTACLLSVWGWWIRRVRVSGLSSNAAGWAWRWALLNSIDAGIFRAEKEEPRSETERRTRKRRFFLLKTRLKNTSLDPVYRTLACL